MKALIFLLLAFTTAAFGQEQPKGLTPAEKLKWIRAHPPPSQRGRSEQPPPTRPTPPPPPTTQTPLPPEPRLAPPSQDNLPAQTRAPVPPPPRPYLDKLPRPTTMYVKPPSTTGKSASVFNSVGFNYLTCPRNPKCERIGFAEKNDPVKVMGTTCGDLTNPGIGFDCASAQGERYFQVEFTDDDGKTVLAYIQATYLTFEKPEDAKPAPTPPKEEVPKPEPPKPEPEPVIPVPDPKKELEGRLPECKDCEERTRALRRAQEEAAKKLKAIADAKAKEEGRRAKEAAKHPAPGSVPPGPVPDMGDVQKIRPMCQNILKEDGSLGPWGEILKDAKDNVGIDCFMNAVKWRPVCPKFDSFNADKKMQFLAFAFAVKGQHESWCEPKERVPGTVAEDRHDIPGTQKKVKFDKKTKKFYTVSLVQMYAVGLFALEESAHQRSDTRRGPFCETKDVYDIKFQMECSLAIMKRTMCDWGGNATSEDGYWQEELGSRGKISKMVSKYPGCK